jgi:hypothetical protein
MADPGLDPVHEIDQIARFSKVGYFLSYSWLVGCAHSSAAKFKGLGSKKIANSH